VAMGALALFFPAALPADSTPQGSISVSVAGAGRVQSSPSGIDCGTVCSATFPLGSSVVLTSSASSGSYLAGWSGDCVGASQSCQATADEDVHVQAQFAAGSPPTPDVHALTVSYSGEGRVTSSPNDVIDCGSNCWTSFSGGGHVTLTATPASGFVFDGWAGDCSGTNPCDVAVTSLRSVVAVFKPSSIPNGTSTLTITNNNPGEGQGTGTIQVSWPGHSEVCADTCDVGDVPNGVRVTVKPLPAQSTVVDSYGGACTGTAQRCVLILSGDTGVTTSFQNADALTTSYGLNLTRSAGGSVKSAPPGIDCGADTGCRAAYKRNISVRLSADAASGYSFAGWGGDCSGASGCSLSMAVSRTVSAGFRALRDPLRVAKSGRGIGTVTTDPSGIDCGNVCDYSFRHGTQITLRAAPNGRSRFRTWSGGCTGKSTCTLTIAAPVDVTAAFDYCAASAFSSFSAVARPAAVVVRLSLADKATVRVRVLHGGATLTSRTFANLPAGVKTLRIPVSHRARGSKAKVEVRLKDICGRTRALSRAITLR
jgi:Divergent InlB B-repeat domain